MPNLQLSTESSQHQVPTGPFHVCMANPNLPTIGLWIEHLPTWYEEPKEAAIHLIGRNAQRKINMKKGSFIERPGYSHRALYVQTRASPGEDVITATEALL
jgi:hypothetical protein